MLLQVWNKELALGCSLFLDHYCLPLENLLEKRSEEAAPNSHNIKGEEMISTSCHHQFAILFNHPLPSLHLQPSYSPTMSQSIIVHANRNPAQTVTPRKTVTFNENIIVHEIPACNKEAHMRLRLSKQETLFGRRLVRFPKMERILLDIDEYDV